MDTLDYEGKTPKEMCERIIKKLRNGSIILMHNDTKYTAQGLQQIIDTIHNAGYEIISLDELIYTENSYQNEIRFQHNSGTGHGLSFRSCCRCAE